MLTSFVCLYALYFLLTDEAKRAYKNQSEKYQRMSLLHSKSADLSCIPLKNKIRQLILQNKNSTEPEVIQLRKELEAAINE